MNSKLPSHPEAYLDFLQLIFKILQESDHNPQIVYSLLEANLDKLDWAIWRLGRTDGQK